LNPERFHFPRYRFGRSLRDFFLLTWWQILNTRATALWGLLLFSIFPLGLLMFLFFLSRGMPERTRQYILIGNLVYAFAMNGMLAVGQEVGWQKQNSGFDFFATLPISKHALLLSFLTRAVLATFIPGILIMVLARLIFHIVLPFSPLLLPLLVLTAYSMVGAGALIGLYAPDARAAVYATEFIALIVAYFSPLMVPKEHLPTLLQWTSMVLPTTYAAEAWRLLSHVEIGRDPSRLMLDFGVLGGFVVISFALIEYKFDWRK